jgi:flagellar hook assembly protein FlgD
VEDRRGELPKTFNISQNRPNPFSSTTEIRYAVPVDAEVSLEIYDVQGKKIRTLVSGSSEPGFHTAVWDGRDDSKKAVAPGVYYARMVAPNYRESLKLMYLR